MIENFKKIEYRKVYRLMLRTKEESSGGYTQIR